MIGYNMERQEDGYDMLPLTDRWCCLWLSRSSETLSSEILSMSTKDTGGDFEPTSLHSRWNDLQNVAACLFVLLPHVILLCSLSFLTFLVLSACAFVVLLSLSISLWPPGLAVRGAPLAFSSLAAPQGIYPPSAFSLVFFHSAALEPKLHPETPKHIDFSISLVFFFFFSVCSHAPTRTATR